MSLERDYAIFNAILSPIFGEDIEIGRSYSSPIPGRGDTSPSFQIYQGDYNIDTDIDYSDVLYWKDWGYGKHFGHRPQHLLMHLKGITLEQAKGIIVSGNYPALPIKKTFRSELRHVSTPNLSKRELAYWKQFHISKELLNKYKVRGVRQLFETKEGIEKCIYDHTAGPATFVYLGPEEPFQVYRPEPKWYRRSSGKAFVIGYEQLPYKGRILLILSGMKDGLSLITATGWPFLAGSGEMDYESIGDLLPELRERFDYIGVCMDPDKAGQDANILYRDKLNLPIFGFPYPNEKEDIAKLMRRYGPVKLRNAFYNKTKLW